MLLVIPVFPYVFVSTGKRYRDRFYVTLEATEENSITDLLENVRSAHYGMFNSLPPVFWIIGEIETVNTHSFNRFETGVEGGYDDDPVHSSVLEKSIRDISLTGKLVASFNYPLGKKIKEVSDTKNPGE